MLIQCFTIIKYIVSNVSNTTLHTIGILLYEFHRAQSENTIKVFCMDKQQQRQADIYKYRYRQCALYCILQAFIH